MTLTKTHRTTNCCDYAQVWLMTLTNFTWTTSSQSFNFNTMESLTIPQKLCVGGGEEAFNNQHFLECTIMTSQPSCWRELNIVCLFYSGRWREKLQLKCWKLTTQVQIAMEENYIDVEMFRTNSKDKESTLPTYSQPSNDYLQLQRNASYRSDSAIKKHVHSREQGQNQDTTVPQLTRNKCLCVIAVSLLIGLLLAMSTISIALSYRAFISESVSTHVNNQQQVVYLNEGNLSQVFDQLRENRNDITALQSTLHNLETQVNCGPGQWTRVAYFDMGNLGEQCPPNWREYNSSGIRACGRQTNGCNSKTYKTSNRLYNKVCGRAIGYQFGDTDVFHNSQAGIDSSYVDGLSITHGIPRKHIWTFAAGISQTLLQQQLEQFVCPCLAATSSIRVVPQTPPVYVGDNYFCESGNPTNTIWRANLYTDDPLWDGQQCEGQCCTNGTSPPWFSVELPVPTSDDIEVRICATTSRRYEDTPIKLLELYIQ